MHRMLSPRAALPALALAPALAAAQPAGAFRALDAYAESARAAWKVPGLAIAVVRNDSVVYAKGFGVREVGKPDLVTERTIFAIGSSSKAFTAAAVAMLVDEKKVALDAPAATYLPGFQVYDPYASRELTVRDLLSHRSGLARGELAWYGSGFDRDEIVRRVRFLQPSWSFRGQFGYQNIMYIAAGQVAARVANTTWDDFVRERIFVPLGMTASSTTVRGLSSQPNLATPHAAVGAAGDTVRAVAWRNLDNAGAAGSINSHAVDMAQWVRLQLGKGKFGGRQLISARLVDEMHAPQTIVRLDSAARANNPETHLQAYGLGWFLEDYRGRFVVHHGGNVDGFTALVGMMPEENVGVVILTNMNGTGLPTTLMRKAFDLHLGGASRDWSAEGLKRVEAARARALAAERRQAAQRVPNTKPSLPPAEYAGVYVDSLYGELEIREQGGKLTLAFGPAWRGELEHWHFDTFRTRFDTPVLGVIPVTFRLNAAGKVDEVQVDMAGVATFRRRAEPAAPRSAGGGPPGPTR